MEAEAIPAAAASAGAAMRFCHLSNCSVPSASQRLMEIVEPDSASLSEWGAEAEGEAAEAGHGTEDAPAEAEATDEERAAAAAARPAAEE